MQESHFKCQQSRTKKYEVYFRFKNYNFFSVLFIILAIKNLS